MVETLQEFMVQELALRTKTRLSPGFPPIIRHKLALGFHGEGNTL